MKQLQWNRLKILIMEYKYFLKYPRFSKYLSTYLSNFILVFSVLKNGFNPQT